MTASALKKEPPVFKEPAITPQLAAEHGIKPDEYAHMLKILGRDPTFTELGIFSVMWSEHCSYKSSRLHLKKLPLTREVSLLILAYLYVPIFVLIAYSFNANRSCARWGEAGISPAATSSKPSMASRLCSSPSLP